MSRTIWQKSPGRCKLPRPVIALPSIGHECNIGIFGPNLKTLIL